MVARQGGAHKRRVHPDARRTIVADQGATRPGARFGPFWRMSGSACRNTTTSQRGSKTEGTATTAPSARHHELQRES
ncbi:MAG: hypothetical protein HPY44_21185 [Armatimonadetes bacterium]|nr:hypothetical protein [Armatimonadota bacterium]